MAKGPTIGRYTSNYVVRLGEREARALLAAGHSARVAADGGATFYRNGGIANAAVVAALIRNQYARRDGDRLVPGPKAGAPIREFNQ